MNETVQKLVKSKILRMSLNVAEESSENVENDYKEENGEIQFEH